MQTKTTNSPTPTSDKANAYAISQLDAVQHCPLGGYTLRQLATAYDAGAAAQSALLAEAKTALYDYDSYLAAYNESADSDDPSYLTRERLCALLARMDGAK
jgi:hypothetical protein